MDCGKGGCFKGDEEVKWAGVVSGGDGTAMEVWLYGDRNVTIGPGFCSVV